MYHGFPRFAKRMIFCMGNYRFGIYKTDETVRKVFLYVLSTKWLNNMSHLIGKPTICIGENKDADQLRGNREADQRLCFRYTDSTIPLLLNSKISSF